MLSKYKLGMGCAVCVLGYGLFIIMLGLYAGWSIALLVLGMSIALGMVALGFLVITDG